MDSANRFNNMKSVNKLICQEVGNDEYMIACNFGSRRMNGFEVIEREGGREGGKGSDASPGHRKQKKAGSEQGYSLIDCSKREIKCVLT